jgi:apolipoprotein N-acyltransferase
LEEPPVKASVLICFEDIFPHLVRRYVDPDTDVLVNLTNNGWFGDSAAQWQHGVSAILRAVENNLPLVRCANNGLTCWVDHHGVVRQILRDGNGGIYGQGTLSIQVPLPLSRGSATFYNRYGDVFGWTCVAVTGLHLLGGVLARRRRPASTPHPVH